MIRITLAFLATLALATPLRAAVDIQEVTSPGGITAWLVEERSIPFVALEIQFLGGSSLDPEGKRGAVNLMTGLIEEGAGDMDARAFAAARDGLAASYSFDSNNDSVSVSAQFLTENRDEAVALLREALVNPRFDQDAIDRVRAQVISNIRSDATDPNSIAGITFAARSYGEDDPYGTDRNGTVNSVSGLTREDMIAAHRATLVRDRVYVGASGDISAEDLGLILDQLLGDLPESNMPLVPDV
ncbi:MAG: pitrilysin family protein, partial [Pseudomonadota bacterium]